MGLIDELASRGGDSLAATVATVLAVGPAGRTVDLDVAGGFVPSVPCSASYPSPSEGDVVLVVKLGSSWHVGYSLGAPAAATALNVLGNPGFELDPLGVNNTPASWYANWVVGSPPSGSVVADSHAGDRAWRCGIAPGADRYIVTLSAVPVAPGSAVRFGVWAKATVTSGAGLTTGQSMVLEVWPAADQDGCTPSSPFKVRLATVQPSATWRYFEVPFTQPSGAQWLKPVVGVVGGSSTASNGAAVTIDDLTLRSA